MSDKKQWWKIGIGTAIAGMLGVGVEEGIRRNAGDDETEQNVYVPKTAELERKPDAEPPIEKPSLADEKRRRNLEEIRTVKKVIDKIYEEKLFIDNQNEGLISRHARLREYLEERIGDKFFIMELTSGVQDDGEQRNYFAITAKEPDGSPGQMILVEYESDGSLSVQDEGMSPQVNIKSDAKMTNNLIDQIHKVIRMREEARRFDFVQEYTSEQYNEFLRSEGYDDAQIEYIRNTKYKNPNDVIKEIDDK